MLTFYSVKAQQVFEVTMGIKINTGKTDVQTLYSFIICLTFEGRKKKAY